jgi:hypothetical protein
MAESGICGQRSLLQNRNGNPARRSNHAPNNVAKRPLEFFIRLAREQLRPTYGQGFRGAPLRTDTEEHHPQTIRPGGTRAKITQPTSEVSRSEEEV